MSKNYSANDIDLLSDIEQIRLRPGMWVGDADEIGHFIIFKEIFDNALDEAICGHAKNIHVMLDADLKGVTVEDDGRGIPFEKHEKSGISALATVFAFSKSGGKYNKDSYETSIGTHGVGSTCTNALSETFTATSWRKKEQAVVTFKLGVLQGKDAVISSTSKPKHGTRVHFRPDYKNIFTSIESYKPEQIRERLLQAASLASGINITFQVGDGPTEKIETAGLAGLIGADAGVKIHNISSVEKIEWEGVQKEIRVEISWGWNPEGQPKSESFVNLSRTREGGQHVLGWSQALGDFFLERAKGKCSRQEIYDGLQYAIHVTHPGPAFASQTKDRLANKGFAKVLQDLITPHLKVWARRNAADVDEVVKRAVATYEAREAQRDLKKAQKDLKVTKKSSRGILPAKLFEADCRPEIRELYIVEGDSAAGSAVRGRNANFQEILPLKGKILNSFKESEARILGNAEVAAIIAAVGGGFGSKFNINDCRVGKIILLSDGDDDGSHISSLILSLFTKHMPALLEQGMVYVVDSPLFKGSLPGTKTRWFGYTMEDLKKKAGKNFSKCEITRLKGHGEANFDEVAEYAMIPTTRKLIQLAWDKNYDAEDIEKIMGDDVMSRKELLNVE